MSRIVESVCKFCRRENAKLFLKGDRCYTDKCAFERRSYPPGQHGQKRLKFSEYALQLREKQKTKRYYGLFEKQFRKYFWEADRDKGETGLVLLQKLEMRLDGVVYSSGLAASRREARQLLKHGHYMLNGKPVNLPSIILKPGDVVEVREPSRQVNKIMAAIESANNRETPEWLDADRANFKVTVKDKPSREQIGIAIEENMIVELYSR